MIPKKIHYCWFGGKPIPAKYQGYMESWKKFLPEYEIIRWDESNFDIHCNQFVEEAYKMKKYAFVSDFARFKILHSFGGVYLDTDVELIRSLEPIIAKGPFMGEQTKGRVATGLGMAAIPHMDFYQKIIDIYNEMNFNLSRDPNKQVTVVQHVTDLLLQFGYEPNKLGVQNVCGINIYPPEYFNPQDFKTGVVTLTPVTYSIHHFAESWKPPIEQNLHHLNVAMNRSFGTVGANIAYIIGLPYWVYKEFKLTGGNGVIGKVKSKLFS